MKVRDRARTRDHFREADPGLDDAHPVDALIHRRLRGSSLRQEALRLTRRILDRLDARGRKLFLALDDLTMRRQGERERLYYNTGFERGLAAGREESLQLAEDPRARSLVRKVQALLVTSRISPEVRVVLLLRIAGGLLAASGHQGVARRRSR